MRNTKGYFWRALIFWGFISTLFTAGADTIVLKNATNIEAFNVEEAGKWILYTATADSDAPLQRISIDKVFAIKVGNGELRLIGTPETEKVQDTPNTEEGLPQYKEAVPSSDNAQRIAAYNSPVLKLKKPKNEKDKEKFCSDFLTIWGVEESSVLSDENIEISFEFIMPEGLKMRLIPQYKTRVTNKTNRPIYIDLANSFKFLSDGSARPYFTNAVYQEGASSNRGASLNLGAVTGALGIGGTLGSLANGIGVGGGSGKSASVSTAEERIMMIPPKSSVFLPPMKYTDGSKLREDYESLYIRTIPMGDLHTTDGSMGSYDGNKGYVHSLKQPGGLDDPRLTMEVIKAPLGWVKEFSEAESPKKSKRIITYSSSPSFSTYTSLDFTLYVRGVLGSNQRWNVPIDYDLKYLECDDESHLLVGPGMVKKK